MLINYINLILATFLIMSSNTKDMWSPINGVHGL